MQVETTRDGVAVSGVQDFCLEHTFLCGQCFRWQPEPDGSFTGVAYGQVVNLSMDGDTLFISNTTKEQFWSVWYPYLDLGRDYGAVKRTLSTDIQMQQALQYGWGIRILNQEPFECLASFVLSSQNTIPRIQKIIAAMCRLFGERISYRQKTYYTFPSAETLAALDEADLAPIKAGYRARYILDAAKKVASGVLDLPLLQTLPTAKARRALLGVKGVGQKVADCVLLFSLKKHDAFPIDVWVSRVMRALYLDAGATPKEILACGKEKFGDLGGFAQQYLFYYARETKLIG